LSSEDIENAVERMYRRLYFRPQAIAPIAKEMLGDPQMLQRRLQEGSEFFSYLKERRMAQDKAHAKAQSLLPVRLASLIVLLQLGGLA
jgi:hypothetical protein